MKFAIFCLFFAGCLWGTIGPVSRFIFAAGVTPLETAFWRGAVAGLCYVIHFAAQRIVEGMRAPSAGEAMKGPHRPHLLAIVLFGIFGVAALESSYVYAVNEGGAALASVLLYSAPLWVNLISWKFFGEVISSRQRFALFLTTCGIVGISMFGAPIRFSGIALLAGMVSGFSYALFYLAGKIFFRESSPVSVYMIAFPVASLAILPLIYVASDLTPMDVWLRFKTLPAVPFWALIGIGVLSTYVPYILHGIGLKVVASGRAAIVTMIEPVIAIILSHLIWLEAFSVVGYISALIVIIGVTLT